MLSSASEKVRAWDIGDVFSALCDGGDSIRIVGADGIDLGDLLKSLGRARARCEGAVIDFR